MTRHLRFARSRFESGNCPLPCIGRDGIGGVEDAEFSMTPKAPRT